MTEAEKWLDAYCNEMFLDPRSGTVIANTQCRRQASGWPHFMYELHQAAMSVRKLEPNRTPDRDR